MKKFHVFTIMIVMILAGALTGCSKNTLKLTAENFTAELGEEMPEDLHYYVDAKESVIKDCELDLSEVFVYETGTYTGKVIYNKTEYPFTVEVKDTVAPKTKLLQDTFNLEEEEYLDISDIFEEIEEYDEYVVKFSYLDQEIEDEGLVFSEAGEYEVKAEITDKSGNSVKFEFKVIVSELSIPEFTGLTDVTLKPGDTFDWLAGVTAFDKRDGDLTSKIEVETTEIDMTENGEYYAYYYVTDSDDNEGVGERRVIVKGNREAVEYEEPEETEDMTIPEIRGLTPLRIMLGEPMPDLMAGVTAYDAKDGDLTARIQIDVDVDLSEPGEYEIVYYVEDNDGNEGLGNRILTIQEPETQDEAQ